MRLEEEGGGVFSRIDWVCILRRASLVLGLVKI